MSNRVVIVGQGPRAFEIEPEDEVWVINGPRFPPRWDVLFQLHGLDHIEHKHGPEFIQQLRKIRAPRRLFMTRFHDDIPAATAFPLQSVREWAGSYLTGSVALLIAYATLVALPKTEIVLDGMMFSGGPAQWGAGEGWAVPCIEYHIGRAEGRGHKVTVAHGTGLFERSGFIYGFEGPGCV